MSQGLQVDEHPGVDGAASQNRHAAEVLEAQTSRGLIVVSALLKLAERLGAPELLRGIPSAAGAELAAMHAELKQHTNEVLDAMWHIRNLQRRQ